MLLTTTPPQTPQKLDAALLRTAFVLVLGPILVVLDTTIVSVGVDAVARDLGDPLPAVQWISTAYLLAVAVVMPLSGWAADRFGARTVWMASVGLFVAASALCGLAWSIGSLIAFRVLQGVGGAFIQPLGQSMMVQAAGPARLGRVLSLTILPISFAPVLGPIVGGAILHALDWRWMFLINVPVGALTLLLAAKGLPDDTRTRSGVRLDLFGLALLSPGLAALVYGLAQVGQADTAAVTLPLACGAILVTGYLTHALRSANPPLINVRLFARRGFTVATSNSFLQGAALYSSMLLLPLYYQQVQHADPLQAGLLLAPQALGTAAATYLAGKLTDRMPPRPLVLTGILTTLAGTLAFTQVAAAPALPLLLLSLLVRGAGLGIVMAPSMAAVYSSVDKHQVPQAAATINTINRVGGALGTATLTIALQHHLTTSPTPAAAYGNTFWWVLALSAATLIPALLYPRNRKDPRP
ncbi:DHA2 family efflux MFS transporter permease subunit [Nonomuraea helvata]|uniref:DHA2 family efflux MFS transporter permease subunit n=1 Tax=Nonomuraea helvata TaxID=37484 RepID=A0ABV5SCL3_9ACTN